MTRDRGRMIKCRGRHSGSSHLSVQGFTLVELMIVLVILGVILAIGLPGFSELTLSTKLKSYANKMVASVYLARGEAIKRNVPIRLCASANGTSCAVGGDWEQGWIVVDLAAGTVIEQQQKLSAGYKLRGTGGAIIMTFDPSGVVIPSSTMTVCRLTPEVGRQERVVQVSTTGSTKVTRTETSTCP